ncbi:glycosyltransferase involved in cell wall biosynthesis [Rhodobium gokarnense]|uniref:Glycosyltransferase involved in cell wall biosynthesis n=1 Tax=Rhodobium gokarnense TaxID=364296 RepID=A0ABT3H7S4_9HYPH|nr:glycosyltransferase involved in cell wall biosynthesis [Rhodobium gokarnense]
MHPAQAFLDRLPGRPPRNLLKTIGADRPRAFDDAIPPGTGFLVHVGLGGAEIRALAQRARAFGLSVAEQALADGRLGEAALTRALSVHLSLPMLSGASLPVPAATKVFLARAGAKGLRHLMIDGGPLGPRLAVAPPPARIERFIALIRRHPELGHRIVLVETTLIARTAAACRAEIVAEVAETPELLLTWAGLSRPDALALGAEGREVGIDPFVLAVRRGRVTADRLADALADLAGCPRLDRFMLTDACDGLRPGDYRGQTIARTTTRDGPRIAVVPRTETVPRLLQMLTRDPGLVEKTAVVAEGTVEARLRTRHARRDCAEAVVLLARGMPELSAARRMTTVEGGTFLALAAVTSLVGAAIAPVAVVLAEILSAGVIAAVTLPRLLAAVERRGKPPTSAPLADTDLPDYTVLVPLYREKRTLPGLVAALQALDYPAEKLDIKLIVEVDDATTRGRLTDLALSPAMDVVAVPQLGPRTKPKALAHALAFAAGDLVTIFDAEDRPEPDQLRRVAERFADGPAGLGCIQASLAIDHAGDNWLTRHFALEYAALFDGLMPWLARRGFAFPLGGTSNHIRREALDAVRGWDPFNVTEDADLGYRLARQGWTMATIASTTWEEAPLTLPVWFRQRTRWYKGWLQTWLVHMRRPVRLYRELGLADFAMFQLLIGGGLAVLALHLVLAATLGGVALGVVPPPDAFAGGRATPLVLHGTIGLFGWLAPSLLIWRAARRRRLKTPARFFLTLPVYWLLMAAALVAAIGDLILRPLHWAKTEHGLAHRPPPPQSSEAEPGRSPSAARQGRC